MYQPQSDRSLNRGRQSHHVHTPAESAFKAEQRAKKHSQRPPQRHFKCRRNRDHRGKPKLIALTLIVNDKLYQPSFSDDCRVNCHHRNECAAAMAAT